MLTIFSRNKPKQHVLHGPGDSRSEVRFAQSWRIPRKEGRASFLENMIQLRKTLLLCNFCATSRMPRAWMARSNYEDIPAWHSVGHCDLCRTYGALTVFVPMEGAYWKGIESRR